jgi:hypothetical protein
VGFENHYAVGYFMLMKEMNKKVEKVKFSPCFTKYYTMEMYGGVEVRVPCVLNLSGRWR